MKSHIYFNTHTHTYTYLREWALAVKQDATYDTHFGNTEVPIRTNPHTHKMKSHMFQYTCTRTYTYLREWAIAVKQDATYDTHAMHKNTEIPIHMNPLTHKMKSHTFQHTYTYTYTLKRVGDYRQAEHNVWHTLREHRDSHIYESSYSSIEITYSNTYEITYSNTYEITYSNAYEIRLLNQYLFQRIWITYTYIQTHLREWVICICLYVRVCYRYILEHIYPKVVFQMYVYIHTYLREWVICKCLYVRVCSPFIYWNAFFKRRKRDPITHKRDPFLSSA